MPDKKPDPPAPAVKALPGGRIIVYSATEERKRCTRCGQTFNWLACITVPRGNWQEAWCGCAPTPPPTTLF